MLDRHSASLPPPFGGGGGGGGGGGRQVGGPGGAGSGPGPPPPPAAPPLHAPPAPAPRKIGVLLVNLGTPEGCDAGSVRRYLREFLSDPRVIENQGIVWKLVLNGIILPVRPRRKAHDYEKIWNHEKNESPLKT